MTAEPDAVFIGGPVATMDTARSMTDAVAVRDGRVTELGASAVKPLIQRGTEVVDLRGRLLLPGFQDAHVHPIYGGLQRLRCDLSGTTGARDCVRRVAEYASRHPDARWVLGGGWDIGQFPGGIADRHDLDTVTGDRPAYLVNQDQHGAWVNTAALRMAGIDATTPDPPGGRIERDAQGRPSGTLHERATELVTSIIPAAGRQEYLDGLLEGQRYLHSYGVTSWHDAIVGRYLGYDDTLATYLDCDRQGLLTGRVTGALWWEPERDESQIAELLARRARSRTANFRAENVKIMQDGVCENFTAAMLEPYLGDHGAGHCALDSETLCRVVSSLDAEGFGVHFHAVGDRAVRQALDAVSAAHHANGAGDRRHQIAHVQLVHPDDVARFASLGVTANIQAAWAVHDLSMTELTVPYLGSGRSARQYPFRSLLTCGAHLAAGSDWPVSSPDPMRAVHAAVNRREPGTDQRRLNPGEALGVTDALAAATRGSAWVQHRDEDTGSIEIGKNADLVVLDANPLALAADEIGGVAVDMTLVGGRVVYERDR